MGYDIHIIRFKGWIKPKPSPIPIEEWLAYVGTDPEMHRDDFAETDTPSGVLCYANPGLAVWKKYSRHGIDGNMAWFDFAKGKITVKNPDEEILSKMRRVAKALSAKVIGDEGEEY